MSRRAHLARQRAAGFTLLEILVTLAILALALVVLIRIVSNNIQITNHAKLLTAATFLARAKVVEIEDRVLAVGFTDIDEEDAGDFAADGYDQLRWSSIVERVELPANLAQMAEGAAGAATSNAGTQSPLQFMAGMMGGMMSMLVEPIRIGLQESVRRVTVRVFWTEWGKGEQQLEVASFLTDPARLDLAMGGLGGAGIPGPGVPGGPGGAPGAPGRPGAGGGLR